MTHFRPNGSLSSGYFCSNCGLNTNMYGTGHGPEKCTSNPKLVKQLNAANPPLGVKPRFVITAVGENV